MRLISTLNPEDFATMALVVGGTFLGGVLWRLWQQDREESRKEKARAAIARIMGPGDVWRD